LANLGYRKPACIVDERVEVYLERRFTAAFLAGYPGIKTSPSMILRMNFMDAMHPPNVPLFLTWIRHRRPDVIICGSPKILPWLREDGIRVPEDVGLIRVDLHEEEPGYAGVNQNTALAAKSAVDLLIGQLHYGELGNPPFQKCVMIEGKWVSGSTIRQQ
jgi:DNA-binding LacI/PurR family transcriptional regulator